MVVDATRDHVRERLIVAFSLALLLASAAFGLRGLLYLVHVNWTEPGGHFQHGYLIFLLAAVLAVRFWRADPPTLLAPDWWALVPLLGLVALLASLDLLLVSNLRLVLLPPFAICTALLVLGREAAARLAWPIAFVYFALPQWWVINDALQALTVMAVTPMVHWTGIPAYIEGNFVQIPSGAFEIAAGCAGLRYLVASLALGAFYALAFLRTWRRRALLFLAAGVLALLANWVRVYLLILVGHLTEMEHYLITVEHDTAGWVVFMVLVSPVLFLGRWLEQQEDRLAPAHGSRMLGGQAAPAAVVSPQVMPAAVLAGLVLLLPAGFARDSFGGDVQAVTLPEQVGAAGRLGGATSAWQPVFVNAVSDRATYIVRDRVIEAYVGLYAHQDIEHRLIRGRNNPLGRGFLEISRKKLAVPAGAYAVPLVEYQGSLHGQKRVIWTWYLVAGIPARGALDAKWAELRGLLRGRHDALVFALSAECDFDCEGAKVALAEFLVEAEPMLRWRPSLDH